MMRVDEIRKLREHYEAEARRQAERRSYEMWWYFIGTITALDAVLDDGPQDAAKRIPFPPEAK